MPGPSRVNPIERMLGPDADGAGPFSLLGLPVGPTSDNQIIVAMTRRLAQVNGHRQAMTPDADGVRLALHAAAAQLLDPAVQQQMIRRWSGSVDSSRGSGPPAPIPRARQGASATAPGVAARTRAMIDLRHDIVLALGVSGGWNERFLRRVAMLSHARGIGSGELAAALRGFARTPGLPRAPLGNGQAQSTPTTITPTPDTRSGVAFAAVQENPPPTDGPPRRRPSLLGPLLVVGLVVALLIVVAAVILLDEGARTSSGQPTADPPVPEQTAPAPTAPVSSVPIAPAVPTIDLSDPGVLLKELRLSVSGLEASPDDAHERFARAIVALGEHWGDLPPDQLVAAHHQIVDFLYRDAGRPARDSALLIAAGAGVLDARSPIGEDQVWPAIWSVGMLARLSRERDLPASAEQAILAALNSAPGAPAPGANVSFATGAEAALRAMGAAMIRSRQEVETVVDPGAWARWADGIRALARIEAGRGTGLIREGLEALILHAPDPDHDKQAFSVMGDLAASLDWRDQATQRWLIHWLTDPGASAADMHVITSTIVSRTTAPGVDVLMVLNPAASMKRRADLRQRYAEVWSLADEVDRPGVALRWARKARDLIGEPTSGTDAVARFAEAVVLARLNLAAAWWWRGEAVEARIILDHLDEPVRQILDARTSTDTSSLVSDDRDGEWGRQYLAAGKNIPVRVNLLEALGRSGTIHGPVDAEILVRDALFGSPLEIQTRARELVRRFADSPPVVNGLLEYADKIRPADRNTLLIEAVTTRNLPLATDPNWKIAARRALVERLLELIAGEGQFGTIDDLSGVLADAYAGLAARVPSQGASAGGRPAQDWVSEVVERWRRRAGEVAPIESLSLTLQDADRRRTGRARLARGPVQLFAAEQASLVELMAIVIAGEKDAAIEQINEILGSWTRNRRDSQSVLEQINASERAMTALWLARMSGDTA